MQLSTQCAIVMSRFRDMGKCALKYIQIYIKNEYRPLFFAADARYSERIVKCAFSSLLIRYSKSTINLD